jgi:hypothetical protein
VTLMFVGLKPAHLTVNTTSAVWPPSDKFAVSPICTMGFGRWRWRVRAEAGDWTAVNNARTITRPRTVSRTRRLMML